MTRSPRRKADTGCLRDKTQECDDDLNKGKQAAITHRTAFHAIPWILLMKQARQGDENATLTFCKKAKEILRTFYNIPYFVKNRDGMSYRAPFP